jgi:uncharacterized protein with PIN domain
MPFKDPEKQAAFQREWARIDRRENPEPYRKKSREYRKRHPDICAAAKKRHYERHRDRILDSQAVKRRIDPEKSRIYSLSFRLKRFGLSIGDYDRIMNRQNQKCPICKVKLTPSVRPSIDHCHTGNHFRAVLCLKCNSGIAMFRHSARIARSAVKYLESEVLFNEQAA